MHSTHGRNSWGSAAALGQGYAVAGSLSRTAANEKARARTPLALVFASTALAVCLLHLTGLVESLPRAVLAAVVLTAIRIGEFSRSSADAAHQSDVRPQQPTTGNALYP
jgi:MFS superfamily sulfate permease-like transporter